MNRPEALQCLAILTGAWPTFPLNDQSIEEWCEVLLPLPYQVGRGVAKRCVREEERFPSIARFRALVSASGGAPARERGCSRCGGANFVEVSDRQDLWMPCPTCNEAAHTKWADGAYRAKFASKRPESGAGDPERATAAIDKARELMRRPA